MDGNSRLLAGSDGHNGTDRTWPADKTRIPDWIYTDQDVYEREIEKIFLGRHWNYVGLDCEVPEPGSYMRSYVGPYPVVVTRDMDGEYTSSRTGAPIAGWNSAANTAALRTVSSARITTGHTI